MKEQIVTDFKRAEIPVEVKYFDPSYFVRSVPANCDDAIPCDLFAVHAAIAGKTNLVIGLWNSAFTHVPISLAVSQKKHVDLECPLWAGSVGNDGPAEEFPHRRP